MCLLQFAVHAEAASEHASNAEISNASVGVCDFQCCGGGLGVTDVMYILWTSVQPHVIKGQEEKLLRSGCNYHLHMHSDHLRIAAGTTNP